MLVENRVCLQPGEYTPVRPVITGDGKAMLASNFREGGTMESCFVFQGLGFRGQGQGHDLREGHYFKVEDSFGTNGAGCVTEPQLTGVRG